MSPWSIRRIARCIALPLLLSVFSSPARAADTTDGWHAPILRKPWEDNAHQILPGLTFKPSQRSPSSSYLSASSSLSSDKKRVLISGLTVTVLGIVAACVAESAMHVTSRDDNPGERAATFRPYVYVGIIVAAISASTSIAYVVQ